MVNPSLFVGSSSEGLDFARGVQGALRGDAEITMSTDGFFRPGATFIETLVNALPQFDFAILALTPDDFVTNKDRALETFGPRDNVIFELGTFMGSLGKQRTFGRSLRT